MNYIDPLHEIQSSIIETLAENKNLSVKKLHLHLTQNLKLKISSQNLYRTVSMLIKEKVISKEDKKLILNQEWIYHFLKVADAIKINYSSQESVLDGLPKNEGETAEFFSDSLMSLDLIWINILFRLIELTESKDWHVYNSHPWYAIGTIETEKRFFERLVLRGVNVSMLYGNNYFLDKYGEKLINLSGFKTKIEVNTMFPKEGYALWVCEKYLVEVIFPKEVSKHFAHFFQNISSMSQFDLKMFSELFKMKERCSLKVELNSKKADRYRKGIVKFLESEC